MKFMHLVVLALFAASAAFAETYELSRFTNNYQAKDGDVLTGRLNGKEQPYKITIANNATVTLRDVTINGVDNRSYKWAGITCLGNCTIVLEGKNTVKGFYNDYPGIQAAKNNGEGEEYTLTIQGKGSLDASSNGSGAGIGGGFHVKCGDITISGGKITATGGYEAAGIGGGYEGTCGNIVISDGDVTATGGDYAAGIGSGYKGTCGDITITNEVTKVVAKKGEGAPHSIGKGAGDNASVKTVTIGGKVGVIESELYSFPVYLSDLEADFEAQNGDVLTGKLGGNYKITIANNATVTLKDATVNGVDDENYKWAGITCLGNCTIVLEGNNTVKGFYQDYPGIQAAKRDGDGDEYTLTIKGEGSLEASSNGYGAGIGGGYNVDCGNITINGGKITATGGLGAAGIGSSEDGTCGTITISDGEITATGGAEAAGIGSSRDGTCVNITISGGEITATGGYEAAGIGGGVNGTCGDITITNEVTKVLTKKGDGAPHSIGKGAGDKASVKTVTIGGKVGAIETSPFKFPMVDLAQLAGDYEAMDVDILTGKLGGNYKITIANNATVTLKDAAINGVNDENYKWAGITCLGNCTIVLEGKNTVKGFYQDYPGIQAAKNNGEGEEYMLTIKGDGSLDASSNGRGAGIGSSREGTCGNITISGGDVTATGGEGAAGIGSGNDGFCGDITITNEVTKVLTKKGDGAPHSIGKGAGDKASVKTVTIGGVEGAIEKSPFKFPMLPVNLAQLAGDYEAIDGDTLTGKLGGNYKKITIADGATVTLKDVTINGVSSGGFEWAGITCLGNCTIVLEGKNTVKGFYKNYPGIQAAKRDDDGEEYTLTIKGEGSLDASSNGLAAGIGGGYKVDCGNITISGENVTATGGVGAAGIGSGYDGTCGNITISGGEITATGDAAGIGGGFFGKCGNITISGGNVTATGGEYAAGIGGGYDGKAGDITISGGDVTATGGAEAAGIGGGYYGTCVNITISGGEITATGGYEAAGIGGGMNGTCGNITITNEVTKVVAIKGDGAPHSIGKGAGNEEYPSSVGTVTIGGVEGAIERGYYSFPVYDLSDLKANFEAQNGDVLTGTLDGENQPYKITIANNATVTLKDAAINGVHNSSYKWAGITCLGSCTIVLEGKNTVKGFYNEYPGIQAAKNNGEGEEYTLTIKGEGSLDASSNGYAAGIGGGYNVDCGNITINGGKITATGGESAAGIGGGYSGTCGTITISDGEITATGGQRAAGIGGGYSGTCGTITISGGEITATGGGESDTYGIGAAGIGGGYSGTCGNIVISSGNVTATGGAEAAGIGGGPSGTCGNITISGGEITATGGEGAAGVGGGYNRKCGTITISGGEITAKGGEQAAGIGGGLYGTCGDITISGGDVSAAGGTYAAGIGGGPSGTCGNITITDEVTKVVAIKGDGAPHSIGKGAGDNASVKTVTIGGVEGAIETSPFKFPMVPVDLAQLAGDYKVMDVDILTGKLGGKYKITIANNAKVTLKDVTINGVNNSSYKWAGITCLGNCTIVLEGKNTVKGFYQDYPGIQAAKNYTLTIEGEGSLEASSNGYGAGIGGGYKVDCGNIVISGGEITATGGYEAAGIGGGYKGTCGDITITNEVTRVVAKKGDGAPHSIGKGAGSKASVGTVTIGGKVGAIERGYYSFPVYDLSDLKANFEAQEGDVLTGTLNGEKQPYKITIANNATVTLKDAAINGVDNSDYNWAGITCLGNCTIVLEGKNTVKGFFWYYPGIQAAKNNGEGEEYTLTIEGEGSLDASSNDRGAGIGGGYKVDCGNIVISDGEITATGGDEAAGIGSGVNGTCSNITISGGNVSATGGRNGAGIGGGWRGKCGDITITNEVTKVVAIKGDGASHSIGKGIGGTIGTVTIGGVEGAIERGYYSFPVYDLSDLKADFEAQEGDVLTGTLNGEKQPYKITIANNATVTLKDATVNGVDDENYKWAGITCLGNCTIVLEGKNTVKGFYENYPGIQAAKRDGDGEEYTLTIKGEGSLEASSNGLAAGIGSSREGTCGNIVISSGYVTATGGEKAAGIGSSDNGTCGNITITNNVTKVIAIKGDGAPHSIGKGYGDEEKPSSVGTVTIGGVEGAIEKEIYVFPAPTTIVDIESVGGKNVAVINGDYSGNDALNIEKDTTVDRVAFNRIFPIIKNSSNYSTIMFPFDIAAKEVGNIKQVLSFLGIGVDSQSQMYYVAVARVWCDDPFKAECNHDDAILYGYKPYLIQLKDGETSISINNTEPLVLKQTPAAEDLDVEQHPNFSQYGNYVFRGVLQGKTWEADSPEVLGTGGVAAYGFASKVTAQYSVGQFVRVDGGAHIKPFRAYIYKAGVKSIKANGDYVLRHTASINDGVQETMDIVIVDGKNGEEHTTVIGTFNSRTGEIRLNHTQRTYDLKGRSVRDAKHRAKGVYLKK